MTRRNNLGFGACLIAIAATLTFSGCVSASQSTVALVNQHADDPGHLLTASCAPTDMKFRQLEILFKIRDQQALDKFIAALNDPRSPQYGHPLTSTEANKRFYPTPAERAAVSQWLESQGFAILEEGPSFIKFTGTVSQVKHAFRVDIHISADGRHFGNTGDPRIPSSLAPFIGFVLGLDNLSAAGVGFLSNPTGQNPVGLSPKNQVKRVGLLRPKNQVKRVGLLAALKNAATESLSDRSLLM